MTTKDRKLEAVSTTLVILLPRLTEPYRHDVEQCIKLIKEVREEMDNGNDKEGLSTGGECDQVTEGET